jgi:hypothetical protein
MLPGSPGGINDTPVLGLGRTNGRSFVTTNGLETATKCAAIVASTKTGSLLTTLISSPSTVAVVGFKSTGGGIQRGNLLLGL